jgi:hypothetical protein
MDSLQSSSRKHSFASMEPWLYKEHLNLGIIHHGGNPAILIATSVLLRLVNRLDRFGRFGNRNERELITSPTKTAPAKIRAFTKQLAFEAAVHYILKRNERQAANSISSDND